MKRILIGFLLLMGGWSPLFAQNFATANLTIAGTAPACLPTACVSLAVSQNVGGATITLSGTWSGTISFYGSGDGGVTLVALTVYPSNSTTGVTTATGNGTWQVNPAGYTNLYAIFTTASSGTVVATIRSSVASARAGGGGGGGGTGCVPSGSANYVLLDSGSGACNTSTTASDNGTAFAYTGTGGVTSPKYTAGTDNSAAGTLQLANGSANAHTIFSSGATTTNTIAGFTVVPTTGDLVDCVVSSTTCTLTDAGVLTANVVTDTGTLTSGQVAYGGGTKTITSSANMTFSTAALTLGVSGTAGTLLTFPASGNFTTTWGSAATASNTILGFATVPTTGDLFDCVVSSTTCTLTDAGVLASNVVTAAGTLTSTALMTGAGTKTSQTPSATSTLDSSGNMSLAGTMTATNGISSGTGCSGVGLATGILCMVEASTAGTPTAGQDYVRANSTTHSFECSINNGSETPCNPTIPTSATSGHIVSWGTWPAMADGGAVAANLVVASSPGAGVAHFAGSTQTVTSSAVVGSDMTNNTVTATQLAAQYSKGSCTEVWGGSGTSFAMTSGDDAISNNSCYNDSGVTRTITALKCRSDNASNTTVLTPTFGSAGTGTAILTGTVTCGNSYAYSATGTLNNTAWTTGTGIDPGMSTAGNSTSIAMIVEYTY